jgi:hypothetical protein
MVSTHSDDWKYGGSTLESVEPPRSASKIIKSSAKFKEVWSMNQVGKYTGLL